MKKYEYEIEVYKSASHSNRDEIIKYFNLRGGGGWQLLNLIVMNPISAGRKNVFPKYEFTWMREKQSA